MDTGQHALAPASSIDFEAFDNYCAAYDLGSANVLGDDSGETAAPVHPKLKADDPFSLDDAQSDHVLPGLEEAQRQLSNTPLTLIEDATRNQGPFTGLETSTLEKYRDGYCEENNIPPWQFNELVQVCITSTTYPVLGLSHKDCARMNISFAVPFASHHVIYLCLDASSRLSSLSPHIPCLDPFQKNGARTNISLDVPFASRHVVYVLTLSYEQRC